MNPLPAHSLADLFAQGHCPDPSAQLAPWLKGLAHPSAEGQGWTLGQNLLAIRQILPNDAEAIAAVLATDPEFRPPWLRILAARAREAGQLDDPNALVQLITRLGAAASWVETALDSASLTPTPLADLERNLFGTTAEQAAALPALTRTLAATARLTVWQGHALPALPKIDRSGARPDLNWCPGRLLGLPGSHAHADYLLAGRVPSADSLTWVLGQPWAFLLATVAYAQYSWAAEARGGLLLELPNGQSPQHPNAIQVLVVGAEGDELHCGSLADLLLRTLDHLQIGLFPHTPTPAELNAQLAPLVGELLARRVWRYRDGLSGEQGAYDIHPEFADACYRIAGARSFGRHGRGLWQAVRTQAEQWRSEQHTRPPAATL